MAVLWGPALAGAALGQEAGQTPPTPAAPSPAASGPPAPRGDEFDWVQLNNGEWLKGEIKDLLDDSFTFESDELDQLSLDWSDVHALYSSKVNTLMFEDRSTAEGPFQIEGDTVTVETREGERSYPRATLRSIVPGKQTEWNYWSGKLSFGGTIRQGNVNQVDLSLFFNVRRRSPGSRLSIEYNGAYSKVDGTLTANNHRVSLLNDVFLTRELYLRVPSFEYFRDEFQNIDYRVTPGAGVGYDIIDREGIEWTLSGGVGYQATRFFDPAPGQPARNETGTLLFSSRFSWEATSKIDVNFDFDLSVPVPEAQTYNFHAVLSTEIELWGDLDLDVRIIWDRQNDPTPSADGTVPLPNDLRLYIGIGWEF